MEIINAKWTENQHRRYKRSSDIEMTLVNQELGGGEELKNEATLLIVLK